MYIDKKIYGLPKPLRKGHNTSPTPKKRLGEYIHKVNIQGYVRFKVHIKRQGKSKIKYFKTCQEAQIFTDMLRENNYL